MDEIYEVTTKIGSLSPTLRAVVIEIYTSLILISFYHGIKTTIAKDRDGAVIGAAPLNG
ncbi:hypothetical protein [Methylacidiphilum caldifontis]|uniref:hypothetical protein n=1 Tax=Methylacidiphilum caldifontis TaxID=2795386 RepID=UPI00141BA5E5|nr:hypothetical protein [Methylacidiphilum caldifontis]